MERIFFKNWWLLALKGFLAIAFGVFAFTLPEETLIALTVYFGLIVLFTGLLTIGILLINFRKKPYGLSWLILDGIIDISIGVCVLFYPELTATIFVLLVALWLAFVGLFQLAIAYWFRSMMEYSWVPVLSGLIILVLSALIWFNPFAGKLALSYLIGFSALFFGLAAVAIAFVLRRVGHSA
jgi:uncharacterized membrane protein HdeD (DUF308 family)